jgi:hypothetical protein
MGDILNLRQARKRRARAAAAATAAENRVKHGRTAADTKREAEEAARTDARLDGHKRERLD